ncbi:MAG: hydrogenase nickel incorporation protein HypB [Planctomycetes bacterium]|nr:hydrogenase nickel incorporation protein HypB [Planctomycetota bacterium]
MSKTITLRRRVEAAGRRTAEALRRFFRRRGVFVVNLIGSPGSGKTSLLEAAAPRLRGKAAVIQGDLETDEDKRRIERVGLPAYQINTISGCHLDVGQIRRAVGQLPLDNARFLFIENVGNLVCPASFEIGEDIKVAVVSVTEGDDKPAKYPVALRVAAAMVLTKTDLLPHLRCDIERMERDAVVANPELRVFRCSARTGEGVDALLDWLEEVAARR